MSHEKCISGHSAYIFDRGGARRVGPIVGLSRVRWERHRDNVSEAMVRLEGTQCTDNADLINSIRTHREELVIYRGEERVWEGPLHRISTGPGYAELYAKDVGQYLFAQPLTQAYLNSTLPNGTSRATEVTSRIENIIDYEFTHGRVQFYPNTMPDAAQHVAEWQAAGGTATAVSGGWNITIPSFEDDSIWPATNILPFLDVRHFPNEVRTSMDTLPYEMTVGTHLQNLCRQSGIDFTVLGRRIIIWDVSRHIGVLQPMTSRNFTDDVLVTEYGADHVQAAFSVGEDGAYGSALTLENLAYYGPWSSIHTMFNEEGSTAPTQAALDSQARRNTSGRSPAPIEVRIPDNSTIFLTPDTQINDLVPGVQVPLRADLNYRQMAQMQKIDSITVTETPDEGETIQVTLTPATKPDSDEEEE